MEAEEEMIYKKNREGLKEYNIPGHWHENRKPGISAMIRAYNEEQWIGPCIESILDIVDEIVISVDCNDRTKEIIQSFKSDKIKVYDYPFRIGSVEQENYPDSIHDKAYYSNWTMSKTTRKVICKWDADMILLPNENLNLRKKAFKYNIVRLCGYNAVALNKNEMLLSNAEPIEHFEPRFFKVKPFLHFCQATERERQVNFHGTTDNLARLEVFTYDRTGILKVFNPLMWKRVPAKLHLFRIKNCITKNDIYVKKPSFIHTKLMRNNPDDYWKPPNMDELKRRGNVIHATIPHFIYKKPEDYINN